MEKSSDDSGDILADVFFILFCLTLFENRIPVDGRMYKLSCTDGATQRMKHGLKNMVKEREKIEARYQTT